MLVVNADLPSLTADDLLRPGGGDPRPGHRDRRGEDGTTNALGLSDTTLFAPLYGEDSAGVPFRGACRARDVDVIRPGLREDVDTLADLVKT